MGGFLPNAQDAFNFARSVSSLVISSCSSVISLGSSACSLTPANRNCNCSSFFLITSKRFFAFLSIAAL